MQAIFPEAWNDLLKDEFSKDYFHKLVSNVRHAYETKTVYPSKENIFRAFQFCSPQDVRVVIIGQDPYHEPGQAHGLSFSVPDGCPMPGSLNHIFQEIAMEFQIDEPKDTNLERWAKQGVLLLNATLTVEAGLAASHESFGWQRFTDAVISRLSANYQNIVFLLWGRSAMSKSTLIDSSKHKILTSTHPSGLSWGKTTDSTKMRGRVLELSLDGALNISNAVFVYKGSGRLRDDSFWGCMHFRAANRYLKSHGLPLINWR